MEDVSIVFGVTIGIAQIETILGIILLSFQICLILFKLVFKVINRIKNNEYMKIEEDIEKAQEDIKNLSDKNDGK